MLLVYGFSSLSIKDINNTGVRANFDAHLANFMTFYPIVAPQAHAVAPALPNEHLVTALTPISTLVKNNVVLAPYFGEFSNLIGGDFNESIQASVVRNNTKIADLQRVSILKILKKEAKNKEMQQLKEIIARLINKKNR